MIVVNAEAIQAAVAYIEEELTQLTNRSIRIFPLGVSPSSLEDRFAVSVEGCKPVLVQFDVRRLAAPNGAFLFGTRAAATVIQRRLWPDVVAAMSENPRVCRQLVADGWDWEEALKAAEWVVTP